jgi:hypothetical protein
VLRLSCPAEGVDDVFRRKTSYRPKAAIPPDASLPRAPEPEKAKP